MKLFDPTRKEFYRTPEHNFRYGVLEVVALAPSAVLIIATLTGHLNYTPLTTGLLGGTFCLAFMVMGVILNQKIVVSRRGIEYHVGWSHMEAKWKDVEKIVFRWDLFPKTEGLLISKLGELPLLLSKLFIPLSLFAENWRDAELGEAIKKYAPHLFEPNTSPLERTSTH